MAKDKINNSGDKSGKKGKAGKSSQIDKKILGGVDYSHYQVEDLLADESFQDWVLRPEMSSESDLFWQTALASDSSLAAHITIARDLIAGIRFKEAFPPDSLIKASLQRNLAQIEAVESAAGSQGANSIPKQRLRRIRPLLRAAMLAGLLLGTIWVIYYLQTNASVRIETTYGQTQRVILPDSSEVILNAHSAITYPKHWVKGKLRNLTLEGEAYFNIRHLNQNPEHIKPGERFVINSGAVAIEVLGTRFDVRRQGDSTSIVLERGSIRVQAKGIKDKRLIQPGERVVYRKGSQQFYTTTVQASDYISWTRHELILKGENLRQIGKMLQGYYGVHVQLKSSDIENRKMEGTLLLDSLPDVIFALSTAMDLTIQQHGDTLIIEKRIQ